MLNIGHEVESYTTTLFSRHEAIIHPHPPHPHPI